MAERTSQFRVLIVEDESRLREVLVRALPGMGFTPIAVRSGEEALKRITDGAPEIAILDLNLPGMDGLECFRALRHNSPTTQVIILTGFGDLQAAREAIRLDVVDFLTKPAPLGEIEKALYRAQRRYLAENANSAPANPFLIPEAGDEPVTLGEVQRQHILATLERHLGNRAATAQELGISLRTLYYKLGEYQRSEDSGD